MCCILRCAVLCCAVLLLQVGQLVVAKDWFNAGYIFPAGFKSRLLFRSVAGVSPACPSCPAPCMCTYWAHVRGAGLQLPPNLVPQTNQMHEHLHIHGI
jgi:hypothetical protein